MNLEHREKEEERFCVSRRDFLLTGGSVVALSLLPGISGTVFAKTKSYPRKRIISLSELRQDKPVSFLYPVTEFQCNNFIVKLGEPAGYGVGPRKDVVAFNGYCPHMGGPLNGIYNKEHKVAGPCPLHLSTFDLTRHGMVISGHSTESLPQVILEVRGNDVYAVGMLGLIYGYDKNPESSAG